MATGKRELSSEQQELVTVGASVGAGCQPCFSHHLKAGARNGLDGEQLLAAVTSAERVTAEAAVAMADHARAKLGSSVTVQAMLSRLEEALASLGAALGANDATNIERQLRAAAELGASRPLLQQAIETAHTVQQNAVRIHLREAERLLDALAPAAPESDAESGAGCGCGAADQTKSAPYEAEQEPAGATREHTTGCSDAMTGCFGTAGPSAMAGCGEMFERFMPVAAAAPNTEQAPAATPAVGSCEKEV
jgi:AhpD family alkylhydroperoxidase